MADRSSSRDVLAQLRSPQHAFVAVFIAFAILLAGLAPSQASAAILEGSPGSTIGAGGGHTCATKANDTVVCWGLASLNVRNVPVALGRATALASGQNHACALKTDSTAICWGYNSFGQSNVPADLGPVKQIAPGGNHTCAVKPDDTLVCWGFGTSGQLDVPVGFGPVSRVSAGEAETCAIPASGMVACWGDNTYGQTTVPAGLGPVKEIAVGGFHTCAIEVSGAPVCWGGNPANTSVTPPAGLTEVGQLTSGRHHSCGVTPAGLAVCWGANYVGQTTIPAGLGPVTQISAGDEHTCAVRVSGGPPVCWGQNNIGQSNVPAAYTDPTPVAQVITFAQPAPATFGDGPVALSSTASSDLPVSFSVTSGPCAVSGAQLTISGSGSCDLEATQAGDTTFAPAPPVTRTIAIAKATPTITWADPAAIPAGTPLSASQLNATASVAGSFVYSPAAGTVLAPGSAQPLAVTFTPASADYETAAKTVLITVTAVAPQRLVTAVRPTSVSWSRDRPTVAAVSSKLTRTDTGAGVAGKSVVVTAGSATLCVAVTSASGVGTCEFSIASNALRIALAGGFTATFAGDAGFFPSTGRTSLLHIGWVL